MYFMFTTIALVFHEEGQNNDDVVFLYSPLEINHRHSPPNGGQSAVDPHTAQLNEWSKLLFRCIRPIGELGYP